ncbi:MAG TPA: SpoIID/LytB domain-containing protein [Longimicrobiales bacterium]
MSRTEPNVRIGIKVDTAAVFVSASAASQLVDRDGNTIARPQANDRWTFHSDSSGRITGQSAAGETASTTAGPLILRTPDQAFVTIGDKVYRGDVLLRAAGPGRISAINVLEMEQYLLGVVGFEIGHLAPSQIEAVKAQAIAARTYSMGGMGSRNALGFDFYPTVADQVYGGTSGEDSVVTRAVLETRGEILTHNGQPILAYYSSTCGGHTADVDESWPWRPPQPYLKGRSDTDQNGEAYCKTSRRYRWTQSWSGDSLRAVLQRTLAERLRNPSFKVSRVEDVRLDGKTESGRATAVVVTVDGVDYRVRADSIRWLLRPTANVILNSSLILDLNASKSAGAVTALEVQGGGWGHGIGMCQVGAIGRAGAGQNYRQILSAYYTDTEVQRLY